MDTPATSDNLGLNLIDEVASANLLDMTTDVTEVLLDSITDIGTVLEAFPVLGIGVKAVRAGFSIRDRTFLSKLGLFLLELKKVSTEERYQFVRKFDGDPAFKKRVGEQLILLLDRCDDFQKATVLGQLFRAYLVGRADYNLFRRLAGIIDRAYLPDISLLNRFKDDTGGDDAVVALEALGLVYHSALRGGDASGRAVQGYSITSLGQRLADLLRS
jgi:hypothetical protein